MRPAVFLLSLFYCSALASQSKLIASTSQGPLIGKTERFDGNTVEAYLGIPYAQPPVGKLRFRKPVPLASWNGTYDARKAKHSCIQTLYPIIFHIDTDLSEDCLYLNVWTPSKGGPRRPVLVWIHGGAFKFGSSHERWYNGAALASLNNVVVVSLNYRLGLFGFLNSGDEEAPGNMGLWDQNEALKWIQRNIANFGGDPDLVTLFGESAGSMSVHAHVLSPHSKGLFRRAVMLSGSSLSSQHYDPIDALVSVTADEGAFAAIFQPDTRLWAQELPQLDDEALKKTIQVLIHVWSLDRVLPIGISYIDRVASNGKQAVRKALIDFAGDAYFKCPSMAFSRNHSRDGGKVYAFVFGYRSDKYEFPEFFGVPHTSDIPYYMGGPFLDAEKYTDKDREVSRKAMDILVSFAKTGYVHRLC
ncbi:cholinesterase-like [Dermacentor andersoni]|uniref:cholinesterase-like n=1 Tax=Dermacentor andersoni TaxID=34620 RepID=UPI003B3B08B9